MIHKTREGRPYDKGNVFILGDVTHETLRSLEMLLERDGYGATVVEKQDNSTRFTDTSSEPVLLASDDGDRPPIPQQVDNSILVPKAGVPQFSHSRAVARDALRGNYDNIVGRSPQLFTVLKQVDKIASTPAKVIICGETGTGKELIAQALHQNSNRSENQMVSINCAAIPDLLLESELFGHEKGAFTDAKTQHIGKFERAHNGTLFLDEVGDMPLALQAKLLRAVENGEIERLGGTKPIPVDVRIVVATHCNLAAAVDNGTFRKDLYYRLNAVSLSLPPLRERREDISMLAEYFVERHCNTYSQPVRKIVPETLARLQNYPWPGNVRELENALIHAVILADGEAILPVHLPEEILAFQKLQVSAPKAIHTPESQQNTPFSLGTSLKAVEEAFILATLAWQNGNRTKTAKILGISIRTLQNRLKDYKKSNGL
ncbi:DNA-binding response regulator [Candidatus Poribacteria bacterium]|nr:MAG: DNA-binding response regulator [Candidatus Poribacteria bacterium]